jgi:hypothetical protein
MWAWDRSQDRYTGGRRREELARYFKLEYGEDGEAAVDRLLAQVRAERHPSPRPRLWARLRQRLTGQRRTGRRSSPSGDVQPEAAASASVGSCRENPAKGRSEAKLSVECHHTRLETVGSGGNATYRLCLECGAFIVSQGGRLWNLTAASSS